ncbi:alpha/beta hydrolase [Mycobacterium aquaticum]|uniref:Alpha/beta hydrolase n=1 Tax=Mycobacterium aquaticum TaxID=1927124 RepID=A0A1X0AN45_9MYCO|nr:alpha/beta fold hydrolase [Mycobacterium aquaticum]ORA31494.1 alpha/beta hydrolase [Mycobacterium aquaticum]
MTKNLYFTSHGVRCGATHVPARSDALTGPSGRPCVVMAHGFCGTRDSGLLSYAEEFATAGIEVLTFDYRGFGDSHGEPRQDIAVRRQRQDYHAAAAVARHLPAVDAGRIALWGYSYAGGHVMAVAAQNPAIAAIVALNPATDGRATLAHIARRRGGVAQLARLTAHGLLDAVSSRLGRGPHYLPAVGEPGTTALVTSPGAAQAFANVAGPTWRNEIAARTALEVGFNRPTTFAGRLACPMLMQVGTDDDIAPPAAARRTAEKAGRLAHLCEYPIGHVEAFDGGRWQQRVRDDQLMFLSRVLDPSRAGDAHLRARADLSAR